MDAIIKMYDEVMTSVKTVRGEANTFLVTVGLHQGSAWSPYHLALDIDVIIMNV